MYYPFANLQNCYTFATDRYFIYEKNLYIENKVMEKPRLIIHKQL